MLGGKIDLARQHAEIAAAKIPGDSGSGIRERGTADVRIPAPPESAIQIRDS
jgi:hypothetical protein